MTFCREAGFEQFEGKVGHFLCTDLFSSTFG